MSLDLWPRGLVIFPLFSRFRQLLPVNMLARRATGDAKMPLACMEAKRLWGSVKPVSVVPTSTDSHMNQPRFIRPIATVALASILVLLASSDAGAELHWRTSPQETLELARTNGKPILVYVTADWCHYCQKMKQDTWDDRGVAAAVSQNFEVLMLDGDRNRRIVKKMRLKGFPVTLIYTPDGHYVTQQAGYMSPDQTLDWLRGISSYER